MTPTKKHPVPHRVLAPAMQELYKLLLDSAKFREWRPAESRKPSKAELRTYAMDEKHYTPDDLASLWGVSVDSIRRIFRDEPGVLKMGSRAPKHKRQYLTLRIPESVAERVHMRLSE